MPVNNKLLYIFIFLIAGILRASGQANIPMLERKVTVNMTNRSQGDILRDIEKQGGFTFSYSPQIVLIEKTSTIQLVNKSVREALDKLFEGQISYKERGKHVILTRKEIKKIESEPDLILISGYVTDSNGIEITEASIFDKQSSQSTISNKYGFYKLRLENRNKESAIILNVNKSNYKDTVIYISQKGKTIINITLLPEEKEIQADSTVIRDSLLQADHLAFINFLLSQEAEANTKNINDTLYQKFQASVIPYVGSNMRLSGNTVNDYSFNLFGGYSMGTRKAELAGMFNIDRDSVKSFQLAGLANIAGGPVTGFQLGGLTNANLKTMNGAQFAGLANYNQDSVNAAQFSGLVNVNLKSTKGFQAAGLTNVNLEVSSATQIAGLLNVVLKKSSGVQIAGLLNTSVSEFSGVQISGLLNYARKIRGSQIGFLNISDSCTGVPVGFLSYVHRGYHQLEISADELYPLNLSFRTGVRSFYNILSAGMKFDNLEDIEWYFGYGIGTAVNLGKKWQLNFDLTMNQPLHGNQLNEFTPLTRLNITAEKRFSKYISIAAGPVFNYLVYNSTDPYIPTLVADIPTHVYSSTFANDYPSRYWIGGKIALRFF